MTHHTVCLALYYCWPMSDNKPRYFWKEAAGIRLYLVLGNDNDVLERLEVHQEEPSSQFTQVDFRVSRRLDSRSCHSSSSTGSSPLKYSHSSTFSSLTMS